MGIIHWFLVATQEFQAVRHSVSHAHSQLEVLRPCFHRNKPYYILYVTQLHNPWEIGERYPGADMPHGVQIGSRGLLVLVSSCQACLGVTFLSVSVRVNNNKTDHSGHSALSWFSGCALRAFYIGTRTGIWNCDSFLVWKLGSQCLLSWIQKNSDCHLKININHWSRSGRTYDSDIRLIHED